MKHTHRLNRVMVPRDDINELATAIYHLADLLRERGFDHVTEIYIEPDAGRWVLYIEWVA